LLFGLVSVLAAAAISYGLLLWLKPLLGRHTLAKPNARSSHKVPTPQGGGIAVLAAMLLVATASQIVMGKLGLLDQPPGELTRLAIILAATVGLALVGAIDDMRPVDPIPRLILQTVAVAVVIATLPDQMRIVPFLPWWADRALVLVGAVWLVNAVNFMDGIDWMTVAEIVPVAGALGLFGLMGVLPPIATLVALSLCGAMIGFAPFNRPVAQLFLGDVGSLPIGLLLSWLLAMLAGTGHPAAALLLPLYYLADATITLLTRLSKGEQITQAHRSHFYQRALDGGLGVHRIVTSVFVVNVALGALALATILMGSRSVDVAALAAGGILVAALLMKFNRARS
jgi:UDP-N-acetylmuramyl pentapeptide phosphotransferase/UDP-N-acetylglucosamine-1-phosphate transferase